MKIRDTQVTDFLTTCQSAKTIKDLIKSSATSFQEIGFDALIFHYFPHLGSRDYNFKKIGHVPKEHRDWLFNTFPQHMNVSPRDPFEDYVIKTGEAIWTSELVERDDFQSNEQQDFWKIMDQHFGLSLIVPVYGPRRSRGCFFLPHKNLKETPDIRDVAYVEYMCSFIHLYYTKLITVKEDPLVLTPREYEVLQLIPLGLSNREIAETLKISTYTVNGYMKQLFEKLEVTDRVLVAQRAFALDLIE